MEASASTALRKIAQGPVQSSRQSARDCIGMKKWRNFASRVKTHFESDHSVVSNKKIFLKSVLYFTFIVLFRHTGKEDNLRGYNIV